MLAIRFRSPVTVELRPPGPQAPAGIFQVTQRFDTPDYYASQKVPPPNPIPTHMATDIGDLRCGAPIVAMASGTAYRIQDNATSYGAATNALGIRIDHGDIAAGRVTSEYWHLASWTAPHGLQVAAGQEIGRLGNTGLLAICHCHVEIKINGARIDPEPLMFGGTLGEDDMALNKADVNALFGDAYLTRFDVRIRREANITSGIIATLPGGTRMFVTAVVTGQFLDTNAVPTAGNQWYAVWVEDGTSILTGFMHDSTVSRVPTPPSGITQAEIKAARDAGFADAKGKAKAGSNAAIEAIAP